MKYIKQYENYAKTGDYIIFDKYEKSSLLRTGDILDIWFNFLRNTIGVVKDIYYSMDGKKQITVAYEYNDIPRELMHTYLDSKDFVNATGRRIIRFQRTFLYDNIENYFTCSNKIDELKKIIIQNKYNL
jgi:hypothetical protein